MEVFTSEDARKVLWKKFVVVIGDSVQRCVYKDLVCLLVPNSNTGYLSTKELKAKGEPEFLGDKLLHGGQLGDVKSGIKYREVRQYDNGTTLLKFYFVTRCFSDHVESVLNELKAIQPHVVIMNSCLWDLHRYGPRGPEAYRSNMTKLIHAVKKVIPDDGVFIWNATMPLASKCKGGFLLPLFENIPSQEILAANYIACSVVRSLRFIFLDLHSIFVNQLHLRANDGIHWNSIAHRRVSNLILHQLCRMWNLPVPNRLIGVPLLPTPPLLGIRPLSRSFSCNSNLNRSYIPYEVDSPVVDKRYVVERSDDEDFPSSNRNRFRLISTPVSTLSTPRSSTKTVNENCSGFDPMEKENTPLPLFASSPIEPSFNTPSLKEASRASPSMIGASPNLPAARPSLLGDSPYDTGSSQSKGGHYSLDKSSGSQFASSTSVAGSSVALAGGSTVEIKASVSGIGSSNSMVGVMVSEAESSPSDVAALPSQAGVTISQIETLVPLGDATYSKETSTVAWSSPSVASTSHLQVGTSPTLVKVLTSLVGTMSSINKDSVPSLKASENQLEEEPLLLNEKPLVEDKHLSEKKRLSFSDGMSIVASLHGEGHSVTEEKCSLLEEGAKPLFLERKPSLLGDKPSLQADKSTLLADKPTVIESKSSLSGNVFKPLIKVELLGDRSSPAGEERSAIAAPLQSLETTDDSVFSPIRCTSPLIAAVPDQDVVAAHPAGAETLVSAVIPCQNKIILCQSESAPPSVQASSLEGVQDGDDDINEQNLREMLLLSQKLNREIKSKKRRSEELNNSNDIFDQSSGKRLRTEVGDPQSMKSRQISSSAEKDKSTNRVVQSVVSSIKDQYSIESTEKQNSSKSASKVETAKANAKDATMARDTCSQSRQGTKRRASDNSEYSHSHKHSKVEEKSTSSQSKHQSLSASCVQSTTKTMLGVVSRKRKISDCISHQSKFLKNNSHQRSATNSKDNTSSSSDVSNVTQHTSGLSNKKNGPSRVGSKSSHKSQSPSHVSEPARHIDNTSYSTSLHDGRRSTRHETTSSHASELSCNASNPNFKVPNVPGKPTTNSASVGNKKRRRTNQKHQRSISMGASIPVVSLSLPQYLNANWANQLANTTSQINNTGNPVGYRSNQTTNTGNPMTIGRQMNTTGNPMTIGRQMNTTGNPMDQVSNQMISRGNQLAYSRQRSYTGNPMMISNRAQSQMCQAARYMANTGNPMTQDQIAQQQMLFNMALHRRRSYPPANPYINSYNDYYQHDNQRY